MSSDDDDVDMDVDDIVVTPPTSTVASAPPSQMQQHQQQSAASSEHLLGGAAARTVAANLADSMRLPSDLDDDDDDVDDVDVDVDVGPAQTAPTAAEIERRNSAAAAAVAAVMGGDDTDDDGDPSNRAPMVVDVDDADEPSTPSLSDDDLLDIDDDDLDDVMLAMHGSPRQETPNQATCFGAGDTFDNVALAGASPAAAAAGAPTSATASAAAAATHGSVASPNMVLAASASKLSPDELAQLLNRTSFYNEEIKTLQRGKLIGKGNFGNVFRATSASNRVYAVKQVRIASDDNTTIKQCKREVDLMVRLPPHRNCVRYIGSRVSTRHFSIVMEFVRGGTVSAALQRDVPLPEARVRSIVRDVLAGLRHLHSCSVVHQDIKGANVLLSARGVAKIADFGCARDISRLTQGQVGGGTPMWMAPEVCKGAVADRRADIWALGCLVLEMLHPQHIPWTNFQPGVNLMGVLYAIGHAAAPPPFPATASPECREFLSRCLAIDPDDRWSADDLAARCPFVAAPPPNAAGGAGSRGAGAGVGGGAGGDGDASDIDLSSDESVDDIVRAAGDDVPSGVPLTGAGSVATADPTGRLRGNSGAASSSPSDGRRTTEHDVTATHDTDLDEALHSIQNAERSQRQRDGGGGGGADPVRGGDDDGTDLGNGSVEHRSYDYAAKLRVCDSETQSPTTSQPVVISSSPAMRPVSPPRDIVSSGDAAALLLGDQAVASSTNAAAAAAAAASVAATANVVAAPVVMPPRAPAAPLLVFSSSGKGKVDAGGGGPSQPSPSPVGATDEAQMAPSLSVSGL